MKKINLVVFGIGITGSKIVNQLLALEREFRLDKHIRVEITMLVNSTTVFIKKEGKRNAWEAIFYKKNKRYTFHDVFRVIRKKELKNLVAIDATNSMQFKESYEELLKNDFNIIDAGEISFPLSLDFYKILESSINKDHKLLAYG